MSTHRYPSARRGDVFDDLHGTRVDDPYRWLEDPECLDTQQFVDAQNVCYQREVAASAPLRENISAKMTTLFDYPKTGCFRREGGHLIHEFNSGLQQQAVLFVQSTLEEGAGKVLLDPNSLSDDGTVALQGRAFSRDGTVMSYGLSSAGSDWTTIHFMRVDGAVALPDTLKHVKFSSQSWLRNEGIFYCRYLNAAGSADGTETGSNRNQKLFYHRLGTAQDDDVLIWECPDEPDWLVHAEVSHDDEYLLVFVRKGCLRAYQMWAVCLRDTPIESVRSSWTRVIADFDSGMWDYVSNDGAAFTFVTSHSAPCKRLVRIDALLSPEASSPSSWSTLIGERAEVLEGAVAVALDYLLCEYTRDVKSALSVHRLSDGGHVRDIELPIGNVVDIQAKRSLSELYFKLVGFLEPGVIYRIEDIADSGAAPQVFRQTKLAGGLDLSNFTTEQVFFPSEDGTQIPMFVVARHGVPLDGSSPALLYGYGGFNISLLPSFSVARLLWCHHMGGVLAVANIRGGGEYGLKWYEAGRRASKQNCFTDFQWAARSLVQRGYTSHERLAIQGGSNGGLLVCACANQAPHLFRAVVSQVGVLDILRFHLFTIGHAWTSDFGDPSVEEDFKVARAYSAVHNVRTPPESKEWQYPAMLLLTADHDDRVSPLHSLKYIAALQHAAGSAAGQTNPLLIKVDTKAGHGAGKPTSKQIDEVSHMYAFIGTQTGAHWRE